MAFAPALERAVSVGTEEIVAAVRGLCAE